MSEKEDKKKKEDHLCKCGKTYKNRQGLYRHQLKCVKNVEYSCAKCSKSFTRKDSLKEHHKICKGEKKDTNCCQCNKKFLTGWKLERHIKQVHDPNKISKKCGRKRTTEANVPTATVNKGVKRGRKGKSKITDFSDLFGVDEEAINSSEIDDSLPTMVDPWQPKRLLFETVDNSFNDSSSLAVMDISNNIHQRCNNEDSHCDWTDASMDFSIYHVPQEHVHKTVTTERSLCPFEEMVEVSLVDSISKEMLETTSSPISTPTTTMTTIITTPLSCVPLELTSPRLRRSPRVHSTPLKKGPVTPRTRKRKSRLAITITDLIQKHTSCKNRQRRVLKRVSEKLGINQTNIIPERRGRKRTSTEKKLECWSFWHNNSTTSTLTSRPAKLRVSQVPKIQSDLSFQDSVTIISQRNRAFYQSNWLIHSMTTRELYKKYLLEYSNPVSFGTFMALKPFYVRSATTRDIEMCVCKKHLHARWCIQAIIECASKQDIDIGTITSYDTFFQYLMQDCGKLETTYIDWTCTPSNKIVCNHIQEKWNELKQLICEKDDKETTVNLQYFVQVEAVTKKGKHVKRLKACSAKHNFEYILQFFTDMLTKITHHRNQLKHYRSVVGDFKLSHDSIIIDIDFSENLKVPVKYEPQQLHWSHEQITIHSGLMKVKGEKSYHPYLSHDTKHDQMFVQCALEKMLAETEVQKDEPIVIESDNCTSQYKSVEHFYGMQQLCNTYNTNIIRVFGIPEHGKGEVDHVGGIAKTTIRREIAGTGVTYTEVDEMVKLLHSKFGDREHPRYYVKEIGKSEVEEKRAETKLKIFKTILGSSKFQVIVFQPNKDYLLAAKRLCLCDSCKVVYGSCSMFEKYPLQVGQLKETTMRSSTLTPAETSDPTSKAHEFLFENSICAVAADAKSLDSIYFIYVEEVIEIESADDTDVIEKESADDNDDSDEEVDDDGNDEENDSDDSDKDDTDNVGVTDSHGHTIPHGHSYVRGKYMERQSETKHGKKYTCMKNDVYFYKESVVYPFVNFQHKKGNIFYISNIEFCDVLAYAEKSGMSAI